MSDSLRAIESLTRKASRVSKLIGAPIIACSIALSYVVYFVLAELEARFFGVILLKSTLLASVGVTLAVGIPFAKWASFGVIRARREQWIIDAANEYGVHPNELSEALQAWH